VRRKAFLLALGLLAAGPASAQVGDQGNHACGVEANLVSFGIYDPASPAPNDASGEVVMICVCTGNGCGALHYRLDIGAGVDRRLTSAAGDVLAYELYADPARTQVWGQSDQGISGTYQPPNNGDRQTLPVYGRMPPLQRAAPGAYSGSEMVVVTY
jgi:spore coat protein U-like protein